MLNESSVPAAGPLARLRSDAGAPWPAHRTTDLGHRRQRPAAGTDVRLRPRLPGRPALHRRLHGRPPGGHPRPRHGHRRRRQRAPLRALADPRRRPQPRPGRARHHARRRPRDRGGRPAGDLRLRPRPRDAQRHLRPAACHRSRSRRTAPRRRAAGHHQRGRAPRPPVGGLLAPHQLLAAPAARGRLRTRHGRRAQLRQRAQRQRLLYGAAAEELGPAALDHHDPEYEVTIGGRAQRRMH